MNSVIKIYFYLFLISSVFECFEFYRIGGKCGFPGLPHETKIEPQKTIYEDGEEVRYSCPSDKIYLKTQVKKCVSGRWTGPRSTCGFFIRNQISTVKVIDLSSNQTIIDMNTSNYTNEEYPVSYYDGKGNGLVVSEPHRPHKWWFEFSNTVFFDFFLLNVRIPKSKTYSRVAINEIDSIRVKDIQVLNEDNRTCALDFATRQKWAKIFWFWCTESKHKVLDKKLTISFTTYANQKMDSIGLHQVYLTKLQFCGHPYVPLLAKYIPQNEETQQIQCDTDFSVDVHNSSTKLLFELMEEDFHDCIDNQYWAGNPKCLPKSYCELNFDNTTEEISSVKNAYIFSKTQWYAIEGTAVYFHCKPGYEFIGDSIRVCSYNSTWDLPPPICRESTYKESNSFTSSGYMFWIIFVAIFIVIVVILVMIFIIIKRRKRNTNEPQINAKNDFDIYDDITNANEEYSEYNYYKTNEYDNRYANPNENRYETPETTDPYYLTLVESKERESTV